MRRPEVIVIGGGQGGLCTSYHLADRGIDHIVLERGGVGGQLVDTPMGQFHPGHPELDHPPAGGAVSRSRS